MKFIFLIFIVQCSFTLTLASEESSEHRTYYVAPSGNDQNSGSLLQPFRTLEYSLKVVLTSVTRSPRVPTTLFIRAGTYPVGDGLALAGLASKASGGVTIAAYHGETVVITGGRNIGRPRIVKDANLLSALHSKDGGILFEIDVPELEREHGAAVIPEIGFSRPIVAAPFFLHTLTEMLPLCQWPDTGWAITELSADATGIQRVQVPKGIRSARDLTSSAIAYGFWKYDWADFYCAMRSVDSVTGAAEFRTIPEYGLERDRRWRLLNSLSVLDRQGEWYLDASEDRILLLAGEANQIDNITLAVTKNPLLTLRACSNITIDGIHFSSGRGAGMVVSRCDSVTIRNCRFDMLGTYGIVFGEPVPNIATAIYNNSLYDGNAGFNNTIDSCSFDLTGASAVLMGGGERRTLQRGNNRLQRSQIHRSNRRLLSQNGAVFLYGVGNTIEQCVIEETPHSAIMFWGNDHYIHENYISHVCRETGDAGALYTGRDWTQRGTVIESNIIANMPAKQLSSGYHETMGVYLDDFTSGMIVRNNIFVDIEVGIQIGGGRDNVVEQNIFVQNHVVLSIDDRGSTWAQKMFNGSDSTLWKRFHAVQPSMEPFRSRYPELLSIMISNPDRPSNNHFLRNIILGSGGSIRTSQGADSILVRDTMIKSPLPATYNVSLPNYGLDSVMNLINFKPLNIQNRK